MLKKIDQLPEGLLNLSADQLHTKVDNHTLLHLSGKISRPLFISILQHGDETTGWDALKDYLKLHMPKLPRDLCILFGNVEASAHNKRQLDGQPDFNRCWPGKHIEDNAYSRTMAEVTDHMRALNPFASVDIHNNSGRNPHYAGINRTDLAFRNLASLFADTIIYFTSPDGIQSGAFAPFCPAVTIECGLSGTADGIEQTHTFLENLMHQSELEHVPGIAEHQKIYNIFSTVKVKPDIEVAFGDSQAELVFQEDLDYMNFLSVDAGTVIGQINGSDKMPLSVIDQNNNDITEQYFALKDNKLITTQTVIPAMITQSIKAIQLDCLCYLMQPLNEQQINNQQTGVLHAIK
ncbi:M14 family metallopeptidase [Marinicella sp. W31]|uniref:M14 family metallopeptidase n=1 Tax=Marinicella sp. W31 TaxID=3023713 RepID=UPI003756D9CB